MRLSTTLCFALVIAFCYLATVESTPIQKNDVTENEKEVARQSGPIQSPAVPGDSGDDEDDDGKIDNFFLRKWKFYRQISKSCIGNKPMGKISDFRAASTISKNYIT